MGFVVRQTVCPRLRVCITSPQPTSGPLSFLAVVSSYTPLLTDFLRPEKQRSSCLLKKEVSETTPLSCKWGMRIGGPASQPSPTGDQSCCVYSTVSQEAPCWCGTLVFLQWWPAHWHLSLVSLPPLYHFFTPLLCCIRLCFKHTVCVQGPVPGNTLGKSKLRRVTEESSGT